MIPANMKAQGCSRANPQGTAAVFGRLGGAWAMGCLLLFAGQTAQARPLLSTDSPIAFFTNVASRLLASQFSLTLDHIQVYPTNQYTPAVHRVLQVTANLYDASANRPFTTNYPYLPTVFRPLFRRDSSGVFIAGYREVTDDAVVSANPRLRPLTVVLGYNQSTVPLYGAPFHPDDHLEPIVLGIPLVIGAKKGLPNFNDFAMQTTAQVTRWLQFRRRGTENSSPVTETNLMYIVSITNTCGIEAWNSYVTTYPRNLEMRVSLDTLALMTNEFGTVLLTNMVANDLPQAAIPTNAWSGFTDRTGNNLDNSFKAYITNFLFLTNSIYSGSLHLFIPVSNAFERGLGFFVPHWYLSLRPQVRFALVDTSVDPARIVDYVSLDNPQAPADLTQLLTSGALCNSPWVPDGSLGSMWCTNRDNPVGMTYGVANQISGALEEITVRQWVGNHDADVDFFRVQILGPNTELHHQQGTYSQTNIFVCPYSPSRQISFYTSWQANDPLVHYMMADLADPILGQPVTQEVDALASSPMNGLGGNDVFTGRLIGNGPYLNRHYRPWGGNPLNGRETSPYPTNWRLELKDSLARSSDDWDFPTNEPPDLQWIGRVHRGTPWQTIYLKSPAVDLPTWQAWTGDVLLDWNLDGQHTFVADAAYTHPTNDWHLASLLASLFYTNDTRYLYSVNQPDAPAWGMMMTKMTALTNNLSDAQVRLQPAQFALLAMYLNPTQAAAIATALNTNRLSRPNQRFADPGDILATSALSVASPFLNLGGLSDPRTLIPGTHIFQYTYQQTSGVTDEAYEALPSQLLPLLRPDSLGSATQVAGVVQVQFTGADPYPYAVQVSSNLVDWTAVSTNYPVNGRFSFQEAVPTGTAQRFHRSLLLP